MKVLVLCHGNINRSAFVAGLIKRARPQWSVLSAGLKTKLGRPASPKARRAAAERGFSLDEHRSHPVNITMLRLAEHVLYMDGGNEKRLIALIEQEGLNSEQKEMLWGRCHLLATFGCLRRLGDPNYTSDPVFLAEMFAAQELCTLKFLEGHPKMETEK